MKLNHNIYKNYLNKFCSQKDFLSSSHVHVPSSWLFFRVYKEIRKELNKSEPNSDVTFYKKSFFFSTFRYQRELLTIFQTVDLFKKNYLQQKHRNFFLFSSRCQVRTLQTAKAGNKRMKLLRLLVGRAIDHTHEEKKKSRSRFPVAQPYSTHMRKNHCWLSWFFLSV